LAEVTAQRPAKPSKLIDSLEYFAGAADATGKSFFGGLYAFLCNLTHASQLRIVRYSKSWPRPIRACGNLENALPSLHA
jgi:hypothetical protein